MLCKHGSGTGQGKKMGSGEHEASRKDGGSEPEQEQFAELYAAAEGEALTVHAETAEGEEPGAQREQDMQGQTAGKEQRELRNIGQDGKESAGHLRRKTAQQTDPDEQGKNAEPFAKQPDDAEKEHRTANSGKTLHRRRNGIGQRIAGESGSGRRRIGNMGCCLFGTQEYAEQEIGTAAGGEHPPAGGRAAE